jgi:hypothetical protein
VSEYSTIWKFPVSVRGGVVEVLNIPTGARPLSAALQDDAICLWALVDPSANKEDRRVLVVGTGWMEFSKTLDYFDFVDTVLDLRRGLVWHIFVEKAST